MVEAYEAGATVYQLADQFKQHRTTIGQHLREAGVDTRPSAIADKDIGWLIELYEAGWALAKIAKRYGVSAHAVHDRLTAAGVKLRPRGGSRPKGRGEPGR
jgi:hypothetical protein